MAVVEGERPESGQRQVFVSDLFTAAQFLPRDKSSLQLGGLKLGLQQREQGREGGGTGEVPGPGQQLPFLTIWFLNPQASSEVTREQWDPSQQLP